MTEQQSEWSDWQLHDGKGCPCVGMFGHVVYNTGHEFFCVIKGTPEIWNVDIPSKHRAVRFRIRRPRALLDLIQMIADLPAPTTTPAPGVIA